MTNYLPEPLIEVCANLGIDLPKTELAISLQNVLPKSVRDDVPCCNKTCDSTISLSYPFGDVPMETEWFPATRGVDHRVCLCPYCGAHQFRYTENNKVHVFTRIQPTLGDELVNIIKNRIMNRV